MLINVSDLNKYSFCPRIIYLSKVLKLKPKPSAEIEKGLIGHAIRKELSLRQAKIIGKVKSIDEIKFILLKELEDILDDIPHIYKDKLETIDLEEYMPKVKPEILSEIEIMQKRLTTMIKKFGIDESLRRVTPWKIEFSIRSEKLKLSGRIDKVMKEKEIYIPIEIKTGTPPEFTWEGDKLQTCGYGILLEDKFNKKVPYGFVEYTRIQENRPVLMTEKLRREVIYTRDKILEILNGKVIPKVSNFSNERKCKNCSFREKCYIQ